jgi:hypothetical protein
MSYGLLGLSQQFKREAKDGYRQVAGLQQAREIANDNMETAAKSRNVNAAGMGAGIGMSMGGPVGAAIGGIGGYLVSSIFG